MNVSMKAIPKLKAKLTETFIEKEHEILPDISDPKEQLLTIWTPENRADPVYPTMKKARTHSGTEELYYDLTVIIPVHNSGKYLHNCLYSVLNQECLYRLQIIIVDDGSIDNSREILKHFADLHIPGKDIQIIYQEYAGLSAARNIGLMQAEGKYLMFLDSNDYLAAGSIQNAISELIRQEADFVQMQYIIKKVQRMKAGPHIEEGAYTDYSSMCKIPGTATMKIFRSSLFDSIWFPENYWFGDAVVPFRIYPKCQKAVVLPHIGYIYQKNISKEDPAKEQMNRNLESILVMEKVLMKKDLPDGYMDELLRYFTFSIYNFLKYFQERTMQLVFLTACDMIQTIIQKPSEPYSELYKAFQTRDYGIWKWYACRKGKQL